MYFHRHLEDSIRKYQQIFPIIAILGPRQCGKSTLIKQLFSPEKNSIFLDLQNSEDLNKLNDPQLFFNSNAQKINRAN